MAPRLPGIAFACCVRAVLAVDPARRDTDDDILGGTGRGGGFTTLSPDPTKLVWDSPVAAHPGLLAGWLSVPVSHDPYTTAYEEPPRACLRVLMKPARRQPAKLGPILLHCGGPGSDASCAFEFGWGKWFELNSTYLVGPPLSDDYDYWSITQRGMDQDSLAPFGFNSTCPFKVNGHPIAAWPRTRCHGIDSLVAERGIKEVLKRLDGHPDESMVGMLQKVREGPDAQTFGVMYYNETYVRWLYRLTALENNLCFQDPRYVIRSPVTNRSYNTLEHTSTTKLAYDIEVLRQAIGAQKMSVDGVSYGTKVGSVYATMFPDKVHRLILDGDMGSHPHVQQFASWVGESTEEVWAGLAMACDGSVMRGAPPEDLCPAGPGSTAKLLGLLQGAVSSAAKDKAFTMFGTIMQVIYTPGVPGAAHLMQCLATMSTGNVSEGCSRGLYPGIGGLETIAMVLGLDLAGRLTEQSLVEWWRREKELQPLGITRSLAFVTAVGTWPAVPRPDPPAGDPSVAPLVIGNLHDGQTPYANAQHMLEAFPSGRLLTSQFYGHGLQGPRNVTAVVARYEEEMRRGERPTYDDEVAKLLCVKVALRYLKDGTLPRDHVCKAAGPVQTGPGPKAARAGAAEARVLI